MNWILAVGLVVAALATAQPAHADHVRISFEEPPDDAAVGLLIAGKGKTVSRASAERVLANVPKASCPCPITIYLTLPRREEHNVNRYRIAIAGGGYRGLLDSDRTRIPGLVSIYDIEPTVKALDDGEEPPLTSRAVADPEGKLRELDDRLTEAHDSRSPASYVVFGLTALFGLLTLILGSAFWGRAALLVGPVALAAALALSALEITSPRTVGLTLLGLVGLCSLPIAAVTRRPVALAAALLSIFVVYAVVLATSQETSSLAAFGPHPDGGVRFYGISNQVETLLLVPGLLGAALLGASFVPVVGALVLVVVGASGLGADGGGILVFGAGFLFLWLTAARDLAHGAKRRACWRSGGRAGARPRRRRRGSRRLEPHQPHARWRAGRPGRGARAPLAGVTRRVRRHLARDGDHLGVARSACVACIPPAALGRRRRRARRARRLAARQRLAAGRRCIWRDLVRGAAILVRRVE